MGVYVCDISSKGQTSANFILIAAIQHMVELRLKLKNSDIKILGYNS